MPTGRPVEITRTELSPAELRRATTRSRDADAARRMLALALVLEGKSLKEAAESCGMDWQTLQDWVVRYNEVGLTGLADRMLRRLRADREENRDPGAMIRSGRTRTA